MEEDTDQTKSDRAPKEKANAEKLAFTTELAGEARKYFEAPENQAKIAVFLKKVGLEADVLTDEQRYNFALMIEGKKEG